MKEVEKRNSHSYKTTDKVYNKAMRRAKKEKTPLAQEIESFIKHYSNNATIYFHYPPKERIL